MIVGIVGVVLFFVLSLYYQAQGIYGGDSGDIVTAAVTGGVPHPPGYPLQTLLGLLISQVPWSTPAWRVSLVSSVSHALTLLLIYKLVYALTRSRLAALAGASALAFNYVFFLYTVTPEVFGLFDLFLALILWLTYRALSQQKLRYILLLIFVFGLSLSHQHIILFIVPAVFFALSRMRRTFVGFRCAALFLCGLVPYLYVPFAARQGSIINWNYVTGASRFIALVTRADYGTFVSGGFYGEALLERFIGVKAFLQILFLDWRMILAFAALGAYWLYLRQRKFAIVLGIALVSFGPLFFFYASFPLVNRFTIGTYERFMLPTYLITAILFGVGTHAAMILTSRLTNRYGRVLKMGFWVLIMIFLAGRLYGTLSVFWGLSQDRTADNFGRDILSGLPARSILLLGKDTPLFITQYVRYALGYRPDIYVLHASRLETKSYRELVSRVFPDLWVSGEVSNATIEEFVNHNRTRPIYANTRFAVPGEWIWVPYGLVFALMPVGDLPSVSETIAQNEKLWSSYHDPTGGILSRYNHLMLADVRDGYGSPRLEYGKMLLKANDLPRAREQFSEVIRLSGDVTLPDGYTYLGLTELFSKRCNEAIAAFEKARSTGLGTNKELYIYEAATYRDCLLDPKKARVAQDRYDELRKAQETKLEGP